MITPEQHYYNLPEVDQALIEEYIDILVKPYLKKGVEFFHISFWQMPRDKQIRMVETMRRWGWEIQIYRGFSTGGEFCAYYWQFIKPERYKFKNLNWLERLKVWQKSKTYSKSLKS